MDNETNFMSIEEMKNRKWSINWSGGKDSTATVIACIKYDVPIKEVNYVRMMYDDNIAATLPIMTQFVDDCVELFRHKYGIKVNVIKSETCKHAVCDKVYRKSKYTELNGKKYTLGYLGRGMCLFNKCKVNALRQIKQSEYEMIGYAIDEPKRYARLKHPNQESILCTLGITEEKARYICKKNNLLSPLYELGIKRDGCWFCPGCSKNEVKYIMSNYPELANIIYEEFSQRDKRHLYAAKNTWAEQYLLDWG